MRCEGARCDVDEHVMFVVSARAKAVQYKKQRSPTYPFFEGGRSQNYEPSAAGHKQVLIITTHQRCSTLLSLLLVFTRKTLLPAGRHLGTSPLSNDEEDVRWGVAPSLKMQLDAPNFVTIEFNDYH